MPVKNRIKSIIAFACLVLASVLFLASIRSNNYYRNIEKFSAKTERILSKRLSLVDSYMQKAMAQNHAGWLSLDGIPDDIVIYRYMSDTLQSWANQFHISNDNLQHGHIFHSITSSKYEAISPLQSLTSSYAYVNIGPKWYVAKKIISDTDDCQIIGALEIRNELVEGMGYSSSGVNPNLKLFSRCTINSLRDADGVPVHYGDTPLFCISSDSNSPSPLFANSVLRWLALLLLLVAAVIRLWEKRSIKYYFITLSFVALAFIISLIWASQMKLNTPLFSPTLFAGGEFLTSLGTFLLTNIAVFLFVLCTFIMRRRLLQKAYAGKIRAILFNVCLIAFIAGILVFMHISMGSIIRNSNISLDLLRISSISYYTGLVYLSFASLLFAVLMLLQMLRPLLVRLTGKSYSSFSRPFLLVFSLIFALYFCLMSSIMGFEKEKNRVMVWSNRLAVDRDLELELTLRSVENGIANDAFIASIAPMEGTGQLIYNRLIENYFVRMSQTYDVSIECCGHNDQECLEKFRKLMSSGEAIASNSRFVYIYDNNGRSSYAGIFVYYSQQSGLVRMLVQLEAKSQRENKGYAAVFRKLSKNGSLLNGGVYSYGRFIEDRLVAFRGNYAYPMILSETLKDQIASATNGYYKSNGYVHFINMVSSEEIILVSRKSETFGSYVMSFAILFFALYALLSILSVSRRKRSTAFRTNFFKSRINITISVILVTSMVVLTVFSITFVIKRNDNNMKNMMSSRLNTIQALIEPNCRNIERAQELGTHEFTHTLEDVARMTNSDLSIFTTGGKAVFSTQPEVFDRMLVGYRLHQDAVFNICYRHQRFYIRKAVFADREFYMLYCPIFNANGKMLAILSTPYVDDDNFRRDAFSHTVVLIVIFILLLVIGLYLSSAFINRLFRPLQEMMQQLKSTSIDNLEKMNYSGNDEIATLVDSYNSMVEKLESSMKQVTQAERDKAWSEMARQVAHEIKNPLTPMQLEIQRLIRQKERGVENWDERFYKSSHIILEQIQILSETANEFSTFAKLYSEEPVSLDLDRVLQDQIMLREGNVNNVKLSYIGFKDAIIEGPKPQLIRVVVNLLNNAIQAVEGNAPAKDGSPGGLVSVCLRKSTRDGYYDMVFEDNGPGVSEENIGKLFTPNFTTKSSGTGLGLAICKNILEKCGGEIVYQRSEILQGACFTVRLPAQKV